MKRLRKTKWWFVAGILLIVLLAAGVDWGWEFGRKPNPSLTPQETMRKLELAVRQGDTDEIAALFSRRQVFDDFMEVRIHSVASQMYPDALERRAKQSSLQAWQVWFSKYGEQKLIYKMGDNGSYCEDLHGSFVIGLSYQGNGYLISHCAYSL